MSLFLFLWSLLACTASATPSLDTADTAGGGDGAPPRWSVDAGSAVRQPPIVLGDRVIALSEDGRLVAVGPDGEVEWTIEVGPGTRLGAIGARLAVAGGEGVGVFEADGTFDGRVERTAVQAQAVAAADVDGVEGFAVTWTDGLAWCAIGGDCRLLAPGSGFGVPGSGDDALFAGRDDSLVRVDADGGLAWSADAHDRVDEPPLVDGATVAFPSADGNVYAVYADDGSVRWSYTPDGPALGGLTTDGERVYFGSVDGHLYALGAATGDRRWRVRTEGPVQGPPAASADAVWFGSSDGTLYAADPFLGEVVRQVDVGGSVTGAPALGDGFVVVGTSDGRVVAWDR